MNLLWVTPVLENPFSTYDIYISYQDFLLLIIDLIFTLYLSYLIVILESLY